MTTKAEAGALAWTRDADGWLYADTDGRGGVAIVHKGKAKGKAQRGPASAVWFVSYECLDLGHYRTRREAKFAAQNEHDERMAQRRSEGAAT